MVDSSSQAATPLTEESAIASLQQEDLSLRYYAAWWLGKFRIRTKAAVDALIIALADEDHRTELGDYPLRRNAARALGKLGDGRAIPSLIKSLECSDFYVREAAAQSLEMLNATAAIPALKLLLEKGVEATKQVTGRPHAVEPCEAVIEALGSLGATETVPLIETFLHQPIVKVQYAALRALYQLTQNDAYGQRLVEALKGSDVKLRRVALTDLGAIGYLPAAEAIAQCSVESSFKLIALKGLLEHLAPQAHLSDSAIRVMSLMDSLL